MQKHQIRWDDCGVSLLYRTFEVGDTLELPPQTEKAGLSPNITLVPVGRLRWTNETYPVPVDVVGAPGRHYHGLILPGVYRCEAIEKSEFACLSPFPLEIQQSLGIKPFEFVNKTVYRDDSKNDSPTIFSYDKGYRYIFIMWGNAEIDGIKVAQERRVELQPGDVYEVKAADDSTYVDVVGYKLK